MCHLDVEVDQAIHAVAPLFDVLEASSFYIRSVRVVPVAGSSEASVHLSLGGGSANELSTLVDELHRMPAVRSTQHTPATKQHSTLEDQDENF